MSLVIVEVVLKHLEACFSGSKLHKVTRHPCLEAILGSRVSRGVGNSWRAPCHHRRHFSLDDELS